MKISLNCRPSEHGEPETVLIHTEFQDTKFGREALGKIVLTNPGGFDHVDRFGPPVLWPEMEGSRILEQRDFEDLRDCSDFGKLFRIRLEEAGLIPDDMCSGELNRTIREVAETLFRAARR